MEIILLTERQVAVILGIRPIKKFREKFVDKGLIGFYSIDGQKKFTHKHISDFLSKVEYKPKY